ncbi:MAG: alkaline phosphatase family protein [Thermoanaerobaculia bacterium]|jgi:predicted AlkP superfamily phosphohydrolase/phosphomutase
MSNALWRKCVLATLTVVLLLSATHSQSQRKHPRMIVVGFDGVDAAYTEKWMNEGKLPNLAKLRAQGTFRPLLPTLPAQTPVSWSTFTTGIDPGRTGIFDFLRRDPKTYLPVFAAFDETVEPLGLGRNNRYAGAAAAFVLGLIIARLALLAVRNKRVAWGASAAFAIVLGGAGYWAVHKYIPDTRPGVVNRRQGIPMWEVVSKAGLKARVIQIPVTFPANEFEGGHLLSGLGVPDLSGRVGKPFYFTSELNFNKGGHTNEFSIEVVQLEDNRGVINTEIVGPPNKLFGNPPFIKCPMTITVAEARDSVLIGVSGQTITLKPGEWSDWAHLEFEFNPIVKAHGVSRFFLMESSPEVKLYLSPINFDPASLPPGFHITAPYPWAKELAKQYGPYKTMGWQIDTWAISEGFSNEQMFWDDMQWTVKQFRRMYDDFLKGDDDLFIQQFEFPDRVAHVMWRLMDEKHPAYDAEKAKVWGDAVLRSYQLMDAIVGDAMKAADEQDAALIVMSDHGFATWRRSINYNTWLAQHGYLAVKTGVEAKERNLEVLFDHGEFWENVDWSKTKAYALGLGNIYINLKGREAQGIVDPAEAEAIKKEIKAGLEALVDEETGEHPVSRVVTREEIYREFDPNMIPDLFAANNAGYRVSWQTSLGGIQKDLFSTNARTWSGDHCSVDPRLVRGIFFYNRKLATGREPYIADIYPTVLDYLNVKAPYKLDGEVLK